MSSIDSCYNTDDTDTGDIREEKWEIRIDNPVLTKDCLANNKDGEVRNKKVVIRIKKTQNEVSLQCTKAPSMITTDRKGIVRIPVPFHG